jgi:hypothetical protein
MDADDATAMSCFQLVRDLISSFPMDTDNATAMSRYQAVRHLVFRACQRTLMLPWSCPTLRECVISWFELLNGR